MQNNVLTGLKEHENKLLTAWSRLMAENGLCRQCNRGGRIKRIHCLLSRCSAACWRNVESQEFEKVHDLLIGISSSRGRRGFSPRENAQYLLTFKEVASRIVSELESDPVKLYEANLRLTTLLDNMTILTFEAYMKGREDVIARQVDEISEISTPVIRVWDGVVALPIIGTLDSSRTQVVMENLFAADRGYRRLYCHPGYFRCAGSRFTCGAKILSRQSVLLV